jgi:hypothetical protein
MQIYTGRAATVIQDNGDGLASRRAYPSCSGRSAAPCGWCGYGSTFSRRRGTRETPVASPRRDARFSSAFSTAGPVVAGPRSGRSAAMKPRNAVMESKDCVPSLNQHRRPVPTRRPSTKRRFPCGGGHVASVRRVQGSHRATAVFPPTAVSRSSKPTHSPAEDDRSPGDGGRCRGGARRPFGGKASLSSARDRLCARRPIPVWRTARPLGSSMGAVRPRTSIVHMGGMRSALGRQPPFRRRRRRPAERRSPSIQRAQPVRDRHAWMAIHDPLHAIESLVLSGT